MQSLFDLIIFVMFSKPNQLSDQFKLRDWQNLNKIETSLSL